MAKRKGPPAPDVLARAVEIPDDPQPPAVCQEALAVPPAQRERARLAVILLQQSGPPCEGCGRGLPEDVTPSALRGMARLGPRDASLMARLFNAGVLPPFAWSWKTEECNPDGARSAVTERLKRARSVEELGEVLGMVTAAMASGAMDVKLGKELTAAVSEQRKMAAMKQDVRSEEHERIVVSISEDAETLVGLLDRLVSDVSRKKLLDFATGLVLEDEDREPNRDTGGRA